MTVLYFTKPSGCPDAVLSMAGVSYYSYLALMCGLILATVLKGAIKDLLEDRRRARAAASAGEVVLREKQCVEDALEPAHVAPQHDAHVHGQGPPEDERAAPVTDKAHVKAPIAARRVPAGAGYGGASTAAALGRPTGRDFEDMSCFLFTQLDARWARDASRKFDDDFVDMFKRLHYPFGISRTALAAVGTAHTWPPLLAALLWLADLISFDEGSRDRPVAAAHASRRLALSEADEVVAGDDHVASRLAALGADRVFYEYIGDAYGLFLSGDDAACDELQAKLEAAFQSRVDDGEREEQTFLARARELENRRAARRSSDEFRELVDAERSLATRLEIEAAAVAYGESAAKLQVVPKTAKNAGGVDLSLAVDARTAARLIAAADAATATTAAPRNSAAVAALATATKARDVVAPKLEELREVLADRVRDVAESRDAAQLEASSIFLADLSGFAALTLVYACAATEVVLRCKRLKDASRWSLPAWWCLRAAAWLVSALAALKPFVRAFEGKVSDQVARGLADHAEVLVVVVAPARDRRTLLAAQAACVAARGALRSALEARPLVAWGAFFVATADAFGLVSWAVDAVFGTALRLPALVARRVVGGDEPPAAARRCHRRHGRARGPLVRHRREPRRHARHPGLHEGEILAFMRAVDDDHDH
ncbi:phage-related minor tail protein [Aureococcus anophagefferens]|nr:phage-related minor tail protein [Aureococcus anophagefferens]